MNVISCLLVRITLFLAFPLLGGGGDKILGVRRPSFSRLLGFSTLAVFSCLLGFSALAVCWLSLSCLLGFGPLYGPRYLQVQSCLAL